MKLRLLDRGVILTMNWLTSYVMQRLYNLGARKFVLMAINPNGCSPMATTRFPTTNGCVESLNRAAQMFNVQLKNLVDDIRPQIPGSNLISEGGTGVLCKRGGQICPNRNEYVYFDGLHPTQAVNVVIATKAFISILKDEVYPFNVKKLSQI
ncbi:hypothetical protein DH2020_007031 [Rehmannia glutinosa]|uniref:GDSL esterase/lipase n=1 Tax=Rehmannia glutinosa TaxID=99300 RepID=A0ABR0TXL1_REHGL